MNNLTMIFHEHPDTIYTDHKISVLLLKNNFIPVIPNTPCSHNDKFIGRIQCVPLFAIGNHVNHGKSTFHSWFNFQPKFLLKSHSKKEMHYIFHSILVTEHTFLPCTFLFSWCCFVHSRRIHRSCKLPGQKRKTVIGYQTISAPLLSPCYWNPLSILLRKTI